jgi:hypothetical protein
LVNLGAAMQHPDQGKIFDLSEKLIKLLVLTDAEVLIQPNNGYGDPRLNPPINGAT